MRVATDHYASAPCYSGHHLLLPDGPDPSILCRILYYAPYIAIFSDPIYALTVVDTLYIFIHFYHQTRGMPKRRVGNSTKKMGEPQGNSHARKTNERSTNRGEETKGPRLTHTLEQPIRQTCTGIRKQTARTPTAMAPTRAQP